MIDIVYCVFGLVIGCIVTYFFCKGKINTTQALLDTEKKSRIADENRFNESIKKVSEDCERRLSEAKIECDARILTLKNENNANVDKIKSEYEQRIKKIQEDNNINISSLKQENLNKLEELRKDAESRIAEIKEHSAKQLAAEQKTRSEERQLLLNQQDEMKQEATELLERTRIEYEMRISKMQEDYDSRLTKVQEEASVRRTEELNELRKNYEQQLKAFKDNVVSATEQLLKDRSAELQGANTKQMEDLFRPIRENIAKMETSMNENREAHSKNTAALQETMKIMMERTTNIGEQADRLSNALQHKNKVMGNWGEMILKNILEGQGFREGVEFDSQQVMKDEDGRTIYNEDSGCRMIPDVILHLPDNRDLIIDAKMSLTAFVEYQNATTDDERELAAARHIESIKAHVKELANKNYQSYVKKPRISSDFVIMFLPHEGAMQLLMEKDPELWSRAFNRDKVYIISGQYLMAAVHMINLTWQHVQQEKNTQEILKNAKIMVERVERFYERFLALGRKLEEAHNVYEDADKSIMTGKQSIAASGRAFAKLGVPSKNILPEPEEDGFLN